MSFLFLPLNDIKAKRVCISSIYPVIISGCRILSCFFLHKIMGSRKRRQCTSQRTNSYFAFSFGKWHPPSWNEMQARLLWLEAVGSIRVHHIFLPSLRWKWFGQLSSHIIASSFLLLASLSLPFKAWMVHKTTVLSYLTQHLTSKAIVSEFCEKISNIR